MAAIFRVGKYAVCFRTVEPREHVHVYVDDNPVSPNAIKLWITRRGKVMECNDTSAIPERVLRGIIDLIEHNSGEIIDAWLEHFGYINFVC